MSYVSGVRRVAPPAVYAICSRPDGRKKTKLADAVALLRPVDDMSLEAAQVAGTNISQCARTVAAYSNYQHVRALDPRLPRVAQRQFIQAPKAVLATMTVTAAAAASTIVRDGLLCFSVVSFRHSFIIRGWLLFGPFLSSGSSG